VKRAANDPNRMLCGVRLKVIDYGILARRWLFVWRCSLPNYQGSFGRSYLPLRFVPAGCGSRKRCVGSLFDLSIRIYACDARRLQFNKRRDQNILPTMRYVTNLSKQFRID